ncbi:MAG: hypothetical protein HEP71_14490 [Roseivirga sp.]|nr:hypothetical protein [Roseivirga sp.]
MIRIKLLSILLLLLAQVQAVSQEFQNSDSLLSKLAVKQVKTIYYLAEDTVSSRGNLLTLINYRRDRRKISDYHFSFDEETTFDTKTTFQYDSKGNLTSQITISQVMDLDRENPVSPNDDRKTELKIVYLYDQDNNLIQETQENDGTIKVVGRSSWTRTFSYEYRDGRRIKETSSTTHPGLISDNYITEFQFDNSGQLVKETTTSQDKRNPSVSTTQYTYNSSGQLIEEKTTDSGTAMNNKHYKYQYDEQGNKKVLSLSPMTEEWVEGDAYDLHALLGLDMDTEKPNWTKEFSFYPNGLIKHEIWKNDQGRILNFVTTYEYFD